MRKRITLLGIGILIVITILAVPAVSAQNVIYFIPQNGTIPGGPSNNITVQVRANLSADSPINTWQTSISFDPACVNITNVTYPAAGEGWFSTAPSMGWWSSGEIKIMNARFNCTDNGSDILLANLTIHSEQWNCTSPLNFTGIVNITRFIGCTETLQMYHAAWINGTVENEAGAPSPVPVPVPALTPSGIIALIGLLIVFAMRRIQGRRWE